MSDLERKLAEVTAERDKAKAEIAMIRENCYYACVSKKAAREDINRVAKDFSEVADHWRTEAGKLAAERDKLAREVRLLRAELHTLGNELTKEYSDRDKWHAARPHLRQMGYDALAFGSPEAIQVADDDGATT